MQSELDSGDGARATQSLKHGLYLGAQNPTNNRPSLAPKPPRTVADGRGAAAATLRVRQGVPGARAADGAGGTAAPRSVHGASTLITKRRSQPGGSALAAPGSTHGDFRADGMDAGKYGFSTAPRSVKHRTPSFGNASASQGVTAAAASATAEIAGDAAQVQPQEPAEGRPDAPWPTDGQAEEPPSPPRGQEQRQGSPGAAGIQPITVPAAGSGDSRIVVEEDPETRANVEKWFKVLQGFKSAPASSMSFVYMRHARPELAARSPYNLLVVEHAEIMATPAARNNYYTMSSKGVTHYVDGAGDFVSLDQFEREYFLYRHLLRFRMFAQYRLWKAFRTWRRFVSSRKARSAQNVLRKSLFFLKPVFRTALLRMRTACHRLQQLRLHAVQRGQLYNLAQLVELHAVRQQETRAVLERFEADIVAQAQEACLAAMQLMEEELLCSKTGGAAGAGAAGTLPAFGLLPDSPTAPAQADTSEGASTSPALTAFGNHAAGTGGGGYARSVLPYFNPELLVGGEFSYALNAARRSYKRQIHSFVRLLDYMVCGALHGLLIDSTSDFLAALRPPPQRPLLAPSSEGAAADAAAHANGVHAPDNDGGHRQLSRKQTALSAAAVDLMMVDEDAVPTEWGVNGGQFLQLSIQLRAMTGPGDGATTSGSGEGRNASGSLGLTPVQEPTNSGAGPAVSSSSASALGLDISALRATGTGDGSDPGGGKQQGELVLVPQPPEFTEAFEHIHATWATQIQSVARLLTHPRLQEYMEHPVDSASGVDLEGFTEILLGSSFTDVAAAVVGRLKQVMQEAEELKLTFADIKNAVLSCMTVDELALRQSWDMGQRDLVSYRTNMTTLRDQLAVVMAIPAYKQLGVLRVELSDLVSALRPPPEIALSRLSALLPRLASSTHNAFIGQVHAATRRLNQPPSSADELSEYLGFLAGCEAGKKALDREYEVVVAHYDLIQDFGIKIPDMQAAAFATLERDYAALRDAMWAADSSRDRLVETYAGELSRQVDQILKQVAAIAIQAQHDMILDERSEPEAVLAYTNKLLERVKGMQAAAERIQQHQRTFKLDETRFVELEDCLEDVELRHSLWTSVRDWAELTAAWLESPFESLQPAQMEEELGNYSRAVFRMERGLVPNKIVPRLRAEINSWRDLVPLVASLRNPHLKERHWVKVNGAMGAVIERSEDLTLQALLDMQLLAAREAVSLISTEATQEAVLEALLDKVSDKWRHVELALKPYKALKDTYVLGGVDEVLSVLEDSSAIMATISASRYVAGIRTEWERLDKQLRLFSDTMDEWLDCQRQWLALEPILTTSDIQRQLPSEARAFASVDRQLKEINRRAKDRPNALQAGTQSGLFEQLKRCNEQLEGVAKNLEAYLEVKRMAFPRFYFLSNDELLQILSQARNPHAVQPHLHKCFDGIRSLDFGEDARSADIVAMLSDEGERVPLGKNLKARGSVEQWLGGVESAMRAAVRAAARRAHRDYPGRQGRWDWLRATPAQLVVVISNIHWCRAVESCFRAREPLTALGDLHADCAARLHDLTAVVRGASISPLERKVLVTLITTDVHNRDVVDTLIQRGCTSAADFAWQMQLRYEYEAAGGGPGGQAASGGPHGGQSVHGAGSSGVVGNAAAMTGHTGGGGLGAGGGNAGGGGGQHNGQQDEVIVRQVNARFYYGCEYLGAQPRLVVTPMTDRAFLTLTGALHMRLGGAPAGPAGTGKTETVKDLAKALGVQCVVFNCGDNLDFRFMRKFFSGLAQCGAWACFDEFNRIDMEVLSVVAQQLYAIQTALRAGAERFVFEGCEMRLLPSCGVFVTMNPGYAGRTELPDNLQALFRPMAMMVPDYALVAEVMLFSEGFNGARGLSRKMVLLYRLASEQLSQQDHYDFGMRALKSVLVTAGSLKRSSPGLAEETVLIRAMRESNLPKLLSEDARLFDAIVRDLFPGVELPEQHDGELQEALVEACGALGMQAAPPFVSKAVQLWETFAVRFGAMLVGPPGGGKTCIYRTLAAAVTLLGRRANQPELAVAAASAFFSRSTPEVEPSRDSALGAAKPVPDPHLKPGTRPETTTPTSEGTDVSVAASISPAVTAARPTCVSVYNSGSTGSPFQPVHTHVINPKAITLGELYGAYNTATNEWQDGLASCIIRAAVVDSDAGCADLQWVVFDGPVDAMWVENMNTVLDDNCMLCLPNGERIKLNPASMRVLFEVADLAAASPATVSRCGMVYVTPDDMGWRPYVRSWLGRLPGIFAEAIPPEPDPPPSAGPSYSSPLGSPGHPRANARDGDFYYRRSTLSPSASVSPARSLGDYFGVAFTSITGGPSGMDAGGARVRPSRGVVDYLSGLFERFLEPLLVHVRRHARTALASCEVAMVASTCALLQTLLLSTQLDGHPGAEGASLRRRGNGAGASRWTGNSEGALRTATGGGEGASRGPTGAGDGGPRGTGAGDGAGVRGAGGPAGARPPAAQGVFRPGAAAAAPLPGAGSPGGPRPAAVVQTAFVDPDPVPYKDPLLDLSSPKVADDTQVALNYIFAYAAVWGVGGALDSSCWETFDGFARELFEGYANYPGGTGTVFDYHLDYRRNFSLTPWEAAVPPYQYRCEVPYFDILVPTVDTTRYSALLHSLLAVNRSVLLTGPGGTGKSAVVRTCLQQLQTTGRVLPATFNFSARTSAATLQSQLEARLEKKRKRRYAAPAGRRLLVFVDDVNLPAREHLSGAQPPIELLRHFQDFRGLYDRKKLFWKDVDDTVLLAACGPPGGGRQEMTPRFVRHFSLLALPPASEVALRTIFSAIMSGFLELHFQPDVRTRLLRPLSDTSVEVYSHVSAELLPTPAKSHYTFSLRDVAKVVGGMLAIRPAQCGPGDPRAALVRLWVHEHMRVYHDRLVSESDKAYFKGLLYELLKLRFDVREEYTDFFSPQAPIIFADYVRRGITRDERVYAEVRDVSRLGSLLEVELAEYNTFGAGPRMELVLFMDAVEHVSRIARILRQPRGNAMLVGVGGSGKQSMARFAAFLADTQVFTLELSRAYGMTEFREDLKKLYRLAGVDGKPVAFLLSEQHILAEAFLEDVATLLSCGEVEGLFGPDEREKLLSDLRGWASLQGLDDSRDVLWRAFVDRVRDQLHVVLALSPVGEAFRDRCRRFPPLLAATTVDWFNEWPQEALLSVSTRFLEQQELGGPAMVRALAQTCVDIHTSVAEAAQRFYLELRRRYYVTPRSYLDLIHLYTTLLSARRQETAVARERLLSGVSKLLTTNATVEEMRTQLRLLQPVLAEKTEATQRLLEQVTHEQYEAERVRAAVAGEEADVKAQATKLVALKDEAQADLEQVLPGLEAAERALSALNKTDIIEIKTFTKPPALVQTTMEGVCILLQEKPDWETAKRLLGETNFIKRLMEYDKDNIPDKVARGLKRVIDDPSFTPDQVAKQSKAAQSLCLWVRAMDTYGRVIRVVEPKRAALAAAQERLSAMNGALLSKQKQLAELEARVAALQEQLQATQEELHNLQHQAELSHQRLARAEHLTSALADESVRWRAQSERMTAVLHSLVGDVFLAAAAISYLGAFTGPYRESLLRTWVARCRAMSIPVSVPPEPQGPSASPRSSSTSEPAAFSLSGTLASAVEIREWSMQGLPSDSLSVDNGVLVTRGSRWPLCIDPQDQACRWIKAMELKNNIRTIRMSDTAFTAAGGAAGGPAAATAAAINPPPSPDRSLTSLPAVASTTAVGGATAGGGGIPLAVLEQCVRLGQPVLLEDCGEGPLDPVLEPLLTKATYTHGNRLLVRLGDAEVEYDPRFRLYLATRLPNPHYLPEVCIRVNLINFTVTPKGLEDQLLGDVVRRERPDLEEAKDRLVVSLSSDKRQLSELEDRILALLQGADPASLLDDEKLIATLNDAKQTSAVIQSRVAEAESTERAINEAREVYRPVPTRGSLLYFVTAELALIDPMYQTSLASFSRMFRHCLETAGRADDLPSRLRSLMDTTTDYVYRSVCRGLFGSHKLLYSFLIATAIQRHAGTITQPEWSFLLRGGRGAGAPASAAAAAASMWTGTGAATATGTGEQLQPSRPSALGEWAGPGAWDGLLALEAALPSVFAGVGAAMAAKPEAWRTFLESPTPDLVDISDLFTPPPLASSRFSSPSSTGDGAAQPPPPTLSPVSRPPVAPSATLARRHGAMASGAGVLEDVPEGEEARLEAQAAPRRLTPFQVLLLVKVLCERRLLGAIQRFVAGSLGAHFTEPPPSSLPELFADATPATPIIFILAHGVDPSPAITRFAASQGRPAGRRLHVISLGQGQGPRAEAALQAAIKSGDWVCLQNCHLAASWMPRLERLCEDLQVRYSQQQQFSQRLVGLRLGSPTGAPPSPRLGSRAGGIGRSPLVAAAAAEREHDRDRDVLLSPTPSSPAAPPIYDVHPEFRLWLTSMPSRTFPVPVLQYGIKTTIEPPKGIRANLLRIYGELSSAVLDLSGVSGPSSPGGSAAGGGAPGSPPSAPATPTGGGSGGGPTGQPLPNMPPLQVPLQLPATPPSQGAAPPTGARRPGPAHAPPEPPQHQGQGQGGAAVDGLGLYIGSGGTGRATSAGGVSPAVAAAVGPQWRKLLFSCAMFHTVLQERRRFGPLGWNMRYEFSDGDLSSAVRTMQMFLLEGAAGGEPGGGSSSALPGIGGMPGPLIGPAHPHIPWDALQYVTGDIVYGGRVTDDNDRRLLNCLLRQYYHAGVLREGHVFSRGPAGSGAAYRQPLDGDHASYMAYCKTLPTADAPEVFGLHANADVRLQLQETRRLLDTILAIQPRVVATAAAAAAAANNNTLHTPMRGLAVATSFGPLTTTAPGDGAATGVSDAGSGSGRRVSTPVRGTSGGQVAAPPGAGMSFGRDRLQPHRFTASGVPGAGLAHTYAYTASVGYGNRPNSSSSVTSGVLIAGSTAIGGIAGWLERQGGASGRSPDEITADVAAAIADVLPPPLVREAAAHGPANPFAPLASGHDNSLGVVLAQEMERANALRGVLAKSLDELGRALRGLSVMSSELEATATALLNNQVPRAWRRASYPSTKALASWVTDFRRRVDCLAAWLTRGQPPAFWLPGFFFPQGFITAVLQNHARQTRVPIDRLAFGFHVLPPDQDAALMARVARAQGGAAAAIAITRSALVGPSRGTSAASAASSAGRSLAEGGHGPSATGGASGREWEPDGALADGGVCVYGLFLEGARWDEANGVLGEAQPGEMFGRLPAVHLLPEPSAEGGIDALSPPPSAPDHAARSAGPTAAAAAPGAAPGGGKGAGAAGDSPDAHLYACPLYKTSVRAGVLSTTGQSSNFVLYLRLGIPANTHPDFWVMRGVAALCALDD